MEDEGTFWSHEDPGGDVQTSIQKLLSIPEPNLEAILNHEAVIQECKFYNEALTTFLSKRAILERLIRYTIEIPPDAEQKEAERFPYVASELFACEVPKMLETVVNNEDLLHILFSFLDQEGFVDPRHSGYFRKVAGVLVSKKFPELENYLKKHPETLRKMAKKVSLCAAMEILVMIGWDVAVGGERKMDWIAETEVIPTLIDQLDAKNPETDAHGNAASALVALVQTCGDGQEANALLKQLESKESMQKLCAYAVGASTSSASNALRVLVCIVDRLRKMGIKNGIPIPVSFILKEVLPFAVNFLPISDEKTHGTMEMQYGRLSPPFGILKLEHMRLLEKLICLPSEMVHDSIAESGILNVSLKLMLKYPFNNLLHNLIRDIVVTALKSGQGKQLRDQALLKEARLAQTILSGFRAHEIKTAKLKANRMGYTAHLIVMSSVLETCAEEDKTVRKHLDDVEGWADFVKGPLATENKNQDTILGGHKPQTHLQSDSDDDDSEQQSLGHFGMDDDFDVGANETSEDPSTKDSNNFADAFEAEWETQAKENTTDANNVAAEMSFEQTVDGKQNSWNDADLEDPFAEAPDKNVSSQKGDDSFADFDANFGSKNEVRGKEVPGNITERSNSEENKAQGKNSTSGSTEFDDFDAAFS